MWKYIRVLWSAWANTYVFLTFPLDFLNIHTCFVIFLANLTPLNYRASFFTGGLCGRGKTGYFRPCKPSRIAVCRRRSTNSMPGSVGAAAACFGSAGANAASFFLGAAWAFLASATDAFSFCLAAAWLLSAAGAGAASGVAVLLFGTAGIVAVRRTLFVRRGSWLLAAPSSSFGSCCSRFLRHWNHRLLFAVGSSALTHQSVAACLQFPHRYAIEKCIVCSSSARATHAVWTLSVHHLPLPRACGPRAAYDLPVLVCAVLLPPWRAHAPCVLCGPASQALLLPPWRAHAPCVLCGPASQALLLPPWRARALSFLRASLSYASSSVARNRASSSSCLRRSRLLQASSSASSRARSRASPLRRAVLRPELLARANGLREALRVLERERSGGTGGGSGSPCASCLSAIAAASHFECPSFLYRQVRQYLLCWCCVKPCSVFDTFVQQIEHGCRSTLLLVRHPPRRFFRLSPPSPPCGAVLSPAATSSRAESPSALARGAASERSSFGASSRPASPRSAFGASSRPASPRSACGASRRPASPRSACSASSASSGPRGLWSGSSDEVDAMTWQDGKWKRMYLYIYIFIQMVYDNL